MNKLKITAAVASLLFSAGAYATTHVETGDAGQTIATAQAVAGGTNIITGNVNNTADLFSFGWGGGAFYVNSTGTSGDSQLFLFDSSGVGVFGNDDGIAIAGPAYLSSASLAAGLYYIGISGWDYDPYSAAGLIFQTYPYGPVYGPSNTSPLTHWAIGSSTNRLTTYQINFQQITDDGTPVGDPTPTASVPETSSSIALLGLGLAALATLRRRKQA